MSATPNPVLVRILANQELLTICATCKRAENRWLKQRIKYLEAELMTLLACQRNSPRHARRSFGDVVGS